MQIFTHISGAGYMNKQKKKEEKAGQVSPYYRIGGVSDYPIGYPVSKVKYVSSYHASIYCGLFPDVFLVYTVLCCDCGATVN